MNVCEREKVRHRVRWREDKKHAQDLLFTNILAVINTLEKGRVCIRGQYASCCHYWSCQGASPCTHVCLWLLQHNATHCNTLHHTAAHCSTLQHTATHCNTLEHTATLRRHTWTVCVLTPLTSLQHTATHCNTLQDTTTHCNTLQHTATHCNTLRHTATYCSTLQHTMPQHI